MPSTFKIDIPVGAHYLCNMLQYHGFDAYVVGGCVRDALIRLTPHDWDICTSAKPEEVLALMEEHGVKTIETGLQHGTVTANLNGENYEITTFRVDGEYSDNRRPNHVEFVGDVIKDLSRRDFTINAMAYNPDVRFDDPYYGPSRLIDPWYGRIDLANRIIRCVGNPDNRFQEDALRIMRALRFAATYGFRIEEKTAEAIHRNKELLKNISAERIQSELTKMLCGKGVLDILLEYKDVMAVIVPELKPCIGFEQNNPHHIYDVYDHIAHAVANYKGCDVSVKMALLLHDIGKPECYSVDTLDGVTGHFYGHSVNSMKIAKEVVERLKFDNKTKAEIVDLVLYHDADIMPRTRTVKRWMNKIGYDTLIKLTDVRTADILAHSEHNQTSKLDLNYAVYGLSQLISHEQQCFQIKDLAINGHDILALGVETGPTVGKVLNHLLDKVLDEEISNEYENLMDEAKRYLKGDCCEGT